MSPKGPGTAIVQPSEEGNPDSSSPPAGYGVRQLRINPYRRRVVRRWIYVYFLLVIFEGALRKWIQAY